MVVHRASIIERVAIGIMFQREGANLCEFILAVEGAALAGAGGP